MSGGQARPMTIGELSRRTGVTIKSLRAYTDWGLIYTKGRSPANYRLYDTHALWCVRLINQLRDLGLTLAEIRGLLSDCAQSGRPLGPSLARHLQAARARIEARITDLEQTRHRIDAFQAAHQDELEGRSETCLWTYDPQQRAGRA